MKNLFLLLLILPTIAFSQELVGKWAKIENLNHITEFRADGNWKSYDLEKQRSLPEKAIAKYFLYIDQETTYLTFALDYEGHAERINCKYILNGDKLTIFEEVMIYENITTDKELYRIEEVVYTRVEE